MTQITQIKILLITLTAVLLCSPASAQPVLVELMQRHGVSLPPQGFEGAFDANDEPLLEPTPGSFAAPLAMLMTSTGRDRIAAAYAFGILAGRSATDVSPGELAAAGQALVQMTVSEDRKTRIAGARVAGRVFAVPFESRTTGVLPAGLVDGLFLLLNNSNETEQLAAMDGLGLVRERTAVPALTERYYFYRDSKKRSLAGGALEALARIGDPSAAEVVKLLSGDSWAQGKDPTALAVAFARERILKDGSITAIRQALDDKSRHGQARGYLAELGFPQP